MDRDSTLTTGYFMETTYSIFCASFSRDYIQRFMTVHKTNVKY